MTLWVRSFPFVELVVPGLIIMNLPIVALILSGTILASDLSRFQRRLRVINGVVFFQSTIFALLSFGGQLVDELGFAPIYFFGFYLSAWVVSPFLSKLSFIREAESK